MSERICRDASDRLFFRNQFLADHIDGDAHGGMASSFAVPRLQNVEAIFFDGELEVLHVFEVMFKDCTDFHQIFVRGRHFRRQIGNRMRGPYPSDDVFALRVDQIFTIEDFFAGGRIACECNPSRACFSHVAEDHRLHIDCRAPIVRDAVLPPINDRAIIHPRAENRTDCAPKLTGWILRKRFSGPFFDQRLKALQQLLQIGDR